MVKIITDSTCDLSLEALELRKSLEIDVIPLTVALGETVYKDGDISPEEIFAWSDANNSTPKTSAIPLAECYSSFKPYADEGRDIVFVCISSELSGTYQAALLAAKEFSNVNIEIVDSRSLSGAVGILALKAAGLARMGKSAAEVADGVRILSQKARTGFLIDTITYLYRGGRCSSVEAFGAKVLNLKPEIGMSGGRLHAINKFRGGIDKVIPRYVASHKDEIERCDPEYVLITHTAGVMKDTVETVRRMVKEFNPEANVYETLAGSTVSSHCGPGTLGVLYLMNE